MPAVYFVLTATRKEHAMRDFVILTDSCCDFSAQMEAELELKLLPLSSVMEGKEYFDYPDHRDIQPADF